MISALFSIWYLSIATADNSDCWNNSQFDASSKLFHQIAVIGNDDRKNRRPGDVTSDIESSQGRMWCLKKEWTEKRSPTKKDFRKGVTVSNATLAFQNDVAIVVRHSFLGGTRIGNCYFEHISSGEIIPLVDVEYSPVNTPNDPTSFADGDFAVVKLKRPAPNANAIRKEDILLEGKEDLSAPVKVISNFAANNKNGRENLTMTTCQRYERYRFKTGQPSNVYPTDCDTGGGSSGAQAYMEVDGSPKFFGIISGDSDGIDGGKFDRENLSTYLTRFDSSLINSYEKLKGRRDI